MKVLLFANTEWYLYNFRLPLARELRKAGAEVILISPAGPYGANLAEAGFKWISLPMLRRSLNPIRELKLLAWLIRIYRAERPDVVHHFTIKCVVYGSIAARFARVHGRINAITGMGYVFTSDRLLARMLRPIVRGFMKVSLSGEMSRLVLQNSDDLGAFEQAGLVELERIRLIRGSGVNTQQFRPRSRDQRRGSVFRAIFAARLLWDKGLQEYVDAARQLKAEGLPIEFLLAGTPDPGNPASVSDSKVKEWAEGRVVKVLGHVDNMADLLSEVDIAVLPSYREGIPKSLIEAAACGLPIVTTDAPGCREVVDHGVSGLLVPVRDVPALVNAVRSLYQSPERCRRMGQAARKKIVHEFSEEIVLAKTMNVYRELVDPKDLSWSKS